MLELQSYLCGRWVAGKGPGQVLENPADGSPLAHTSTQGLDLRAALQHAREKGGPALRALDFQQRGELLAALSKAIHAGREELITLSMENAGTTRSDSKFDIDGATATLMAYAELGRSLGNKTFLLDGELEQLGRSPRFSGGHIQVPRRGVAVHINAFNFPAWGLAEKLSCAFLAGMPVLSKPATATALPAHRMARLMVDGGLLPAGSWSFLCGSPGDLLDHLQSQDVVAMTGSAKTGLLIRSHPNLLRQGVRVNIEADSLNAVVVGPDVQPDSDTWKLFLHELVREVTQKSGQKCTATRRVFLVERLLEPAISALREQLLPFQPGVPGDPGVRMGPLSSRAEAPGVLLNLHRLAAEAEVAVGTLPPQDQQPQGFLAPLILVCKDPRPGALMHELEVFGPVATLAPYNGEPQEAAALVARGGGTLVSTIYSDDLPWSGSLLMALAPYNGRVLLANKRILEYSTGPGLVLPNLLHGGPGRAGGGAELGGQRGLALYLQTVAVQGPRPVLERLLGFQRRS